MKTKTTKGKDKRPELSRSEWIVMQALWKAMASDPEVTVSEIMPEIQKKRPWHFSTAKTLLDRLVGKGYLVSRLRGKTCFYRVLVSREQTIRESVAAFLDNVLDGAFGPLVAYLVDRQGLSREEIAQIEKLVCSDKARQNIDPRQ